MKWSLDIFENFILITVLCRFQLLTRLFSFRKTCGLKIIVDHFLWKQIHEEEGKNDKNADMEIRSLVSQHVKQVNFIFLNTDFTGVDGKYQHKGYQFIVRHITIFDDAKCNTANQKDKERYCVPSEGINTKDVSTLLSLHSEDNHDDFCLAYLFTYR